MEEVRGLRIITYITYFLSFLISNNPLKAKFELDASTQECVILNIYLSKKGLHLTLTTYYAPLDLTNISADEYKKKAVEYKKAHIDITADDIVLVI